MLSESTIFVENHKTKKMNYSNLILYFIYLFSFTNLAVAQDHAHQHEDGIFAYANNEQGKFATTILKKHHYKYDVTRKVLDDLIAAKGDRRMPAPKLKMSNSERYAAYAKPQEALIGLEVKAYDVCTSFGKDSLNALAVLLAHELTHYYEKHDWTNHFRKEHQGMDVSKILSFLEEKMKLETQADYLGGFLAYTAGYPCLEVMPNILQGIYDGYRFPDKMKGYPDLPERKKIAEKALTKLEHLVSVFETANWLVAVEKYEDALKYYNHILLEGQYQSREVYNNMGVMATLAAISYIPENEINYYFPVELDAVSRIGGGKRGNEILGYAEQVDALLKIAKKHFTTAISLDADYAPALLNLACVYSIQKEYFDADYHVQKAIQLANKTGHKKTISDAETLLGVIAAMQDQKEKAIGHFDKAIAMDNSLAQINKDVLTEKEMDGPKADISRPTIEYTDGVKLNQLVTKNEMGALDDLFTEKVDIDKKTYFRKLEYPQSKILINDMPFNETFTFFHITNPGYSGMTKRSIAVGASNEDVIKAYGPPQSTLELTNAHYMHYNRQRLVFVINNGKVIKWCYYRDENSL